MSVMSERTSTVPSAPMRTVALLGSLKLHAHGGRHAVAHQPAAVPQHLPAARAPRPAEPARAFAHAFDQPPVAERLPGFGMRPRLVQDAELDRVHAERDGELVDRRLERQQARRFARRAHVFAARQIELDQRCRVSRLARRIHRTRRRSPSARRTRQPGSCASSRRGPSATSRPSRAAPSRTRWLVTGRMPRS